MLGWKKHKLESRLLGEISITSDMQTTRHLLQKAPSGPAPASPTSRAAPASVSARSELPGPAPSSPGPRGRGPRPQPRLPALPPRRTPSVLEQMVTGSLPRQPGNSRISSHFRSSLMARSQTGLTQGQAWGAVPPRPLSRPGDPREEVACEGASGRGSLVTPS